MIEGNKARKVVFEPKGRSSKFQDPKSGKFIKKPDGVVVEARGTLKSETVDLRPEFEKMKAAEEAFRDLSDSREATALIDAIELVVRKKTRR